MMGSLNLNKGSIARSINEIRDIIINVDNMDGAQIDEYLEKYSKDVEEIYESIKRMVRSWVEDYGDEMSFEEFIDNLLFASMEIVDHEIDVYAVKENTEISDSISDIVIAVDEVAGDNKEDLVSCLYALLQFKMMTFLITHSKETIIKAYKRR